jgi:hypothetical protein
MAVPDEIQMEQRLRDLEATVTELQRRLRLVGALDFETNLRRFGVRGTRGKARLDQSGLQLRMTTENEVGATVIWLPDFQPSPLVRLQDTPGGVLQGRYVGGEMRMSMTATQSLEEHYDGPPQGAYGLVQAVSFSAVGSGAWVQAQTDGSGIPAVMRAYAGAGIAACQILGTFHLKNVLIPAALTGATHNYEPAGIHYSSILELSATGAVNLTGIVPVQDDGQGQDAHVGRVLVVANTGANAITLKDEDANSTAANRFSLKADVVLAQDAAATLYYSTSASRWRCAGVY